MTGGGTGGHVFPALEVARAARESGWEVSYLGSLRGQEGLACEKIGLPFLGFSSEPVWSLLRPKGWRAALRFLTARKAARRTLGNLKPGVIFSTGGYSSAPVVSAAASLDIPFVLHEQNSVPGRTNLFSARKASAVCTVFHATEKHFAGTKVVRTGMPIRKELRESSQGRLGIAQGLPVDAPIVLVMGGSQGAKALNDAALATAVRMVHHDVQWLHLTGPTLLNAVLESKQKLAICSHYEVKAYLDAEEMASALFSCSLAVCRSGAGTLSELASFRKPSILVPYPLSYANHQRENAREFEGMGAASLLDQADLQPSTLEARIHLWMQDQTMRQQAEAALAEWDVPDAVDRILQILIASKS